MASRQIFNNYEKEEDLKDCNDNLISQLQLGLAELKTMVSKYPERTGSETKVIDENSRTIKQHPNISCKKEKENKPIRRSCRSTSTPKTNLKKQISAEKRNTPLSKNALSFLISDTGNLKPRRGTSLNKSNNNSSKKSILRSSKLLKTSCKGSDPGNLKPIRKTNLNKSRDKLPAKPILQSSKHSKTPRKGNRVCFSPVVSKDVSCRKTVDTTMMGYDWISAMVDNDSSINDKPDNFFEELKEFRKSNWNECKSIKTVDTNTGMCETSVQIQPTFKHTEKENYPLCCTGNGAYILNKRLDLVPVHGPYSSCPVCKSKPLSQHDADGYVRVSIPRSTIKSPYRLRPHRRKSFDPSDSVALSMHCLAGWQASKPSCIRGPTNIDLASHSAKPGLTSVKALKNAI